MAYLIRTQVLHRVEIGNGELVAEYERIDPLQSGLEIPKLERHRRSTLETRVSSRLCERTYLPIGRQTMRHARPCSKPTRLDNYKWCNQLGSLCYILGNNTR